tara:strand:+ start:49543 stop:52938 length:3396 start_codon:yes stop_codon:yes gene_type:complete
MLFLRLQNSNILLLGFLSFLLLKFPEASNAQSSIMPSPCNDTIQMIVNSSLETCIEEDGVIEIIVTGGNGNLSYSLDGGLNFSSPIFIDTITIDSLSSSTYDISVRDDSLCVKNFGYFYLGQVQPSYIDSINLVNESCCGGDGYIEIFSSSIYNLSFSIDSGLSWSQQNFFTSLDNGNYFLFIEDENFCRDSLFVELKIDSIANISMASQVSDVICNNDSNGTFKLLFPDPCYNYELWRYTVNTPQLITDSGTYFNNLAPGYYGLIAKSNSETCFDSSSVFYISQPDELSSTNALSVENTCSNISNCNGVISAGLITGGISPFYYYVNLFGSNLPQGPISVDSTFSFLCSGQYQIRYLDANACEYLDTVEIVDNSLRIDSLIKSEIKCYGNSDGEIDVYFSGGESPYLTIWNDTLLSNRIDNLRSGSYKVSIIDSIGCVVSDSLILENPDTLLFKVRQNGIIEETCLNISNDGQIILEIIGGTSPFFHSWISSSGLIGYGNGDTIFSLSSDTFVLSVVDNNGCIGSPSWGTVDTTFVGALNFENILTIDSVNFNSDSICYAVNDGFIQMHSSGIYPLSYSVDSGLTVQLNSIFTSLPAKKYDIIVYDSLGCSENLEIEIFEFGQLLIQIDSIKNVSCFEGDDGYISVSTNSEKSCDFLWSLNNDTNQFINNLTSNHYIVRATDENQCTSVDTFYIAELGGPLKSNEVINLDVTCFGGKDGFSEVLASGGVPFKDSSYSYIWISSEYDTIGLGKNQNNLSSDFYIVHIFDSLECGPFVDTIRILQPDSFYVTVLNVTNNVCHAHNNGNILLQGHGGNLPYFRYFISNTSFIEETQVSFFDSLFADNYVAWIVDSKNCITDTLKKIKLGEPGDLNLNLTTQNPSCNASSDGIMSLALKSATSPYNCSIFNDGTLTNSFTLNQNYTQNLNDLEKGSYEIQISDYNGCDFDTLFALDEPDAIISNFTTDSYYWVEPLVIDFINLSENANQFEWRFGDGTSMSTNSLEAVSSSYTSEGKYIIELIASSQELSNLCNDTSKFEIEIEGFDTFNTFTPNGDNINDYYGFDESLFSDINVKIYNKWGTKVFEWNEINFSWDGRGYNGKILPESVYYFVLDAIGISGQLYQTNGHINLLR